MVVHMALELSLGSKIYLATASGAVWAIDTIFIQFRKFGKLCFLVHHVS